MGLFLFPRLSFKWPAGTARIELHPFTQNFLLELWNIAVTDDPPVLSFTKHGIEGKRLSEQIPTLNPGDGFFSASFCVETVDDLFTNVVAKISLLILGPIEVEDNRALTAL